MDIYNNILNILGDPIIFFPSSNNDLKENKNAMIKYILYVIIVIGILTQNWKLIILLVVVLIVLEIYMNQMININKEKIHKPEICRKSTIDNPMGNVLLGDNNLDEKLCKNQKIDNNLNYNVYYNENDIFKTNNYLRPFITMPSQTHPNDIGQFKKYLYNFDNPTCKLNNLNCMYNEDIKYHKTDYIGM